MVASQSILLHRKHFAGLLGSVAVLSLEVLGQAVSLQIYKKYNWQLVPRLYGDEDNVDGATKSIVTHLLVTSKIFSGFSTSSMWSK